MSREIDNFKSVAAECMSNIAQEWRKISWAWDEANDSGCDPNGYVGEMELMCNLAQVSLDEVDSHYDSAAEELLNRNITLYSLQNKGGTKFRFVADIDRLIESVNMVMIPQKANQMDEDLLYIVNLNSGECFKYELTDNFLNSKIVIEDDQ